MPYQPTVNRHLADRMMDRIDHALGRPLDPLGETYRDHYCTGGPEATELAASSYWERGACPDSGESRYFYVTAAGRKALAAHLREIGDPHRGYVVAFDGHASVVVGTSASKARYSRFLDLSDCMPDLRFREFCKRAQVRRA